jgi:putative chitinase
MRCGEQDQIPDQLEEVMALGRKVFFDVVRKAPFPGSMTQHQVEGCEAVLREWERRGLQDLRWLAYMLATAFWETARTMQPITEYGGRSYFDKYETGTRLGNALGNAEPGDGYRYRGRGFVQITGRSNYSKMQLITGAPLVADPEKALDPTIAAAIMFEGMQRGTFTSKKLADYFNDRLTDWVNARRIINGTDKAETIASMARQFHGALIAANDPASVIPPPPDIPKAETEKPKEGWLAALLKAVFGKRG